MNRRKFIKAGALLVPASYIAVPKSFSQLVRNPLAFDPNLLTAKICRYRAADITGKNDGDTVATWNDSWSTRNLTAATVIPVYKVNIVNGKPVVRFVVTSHGYQASAFAFPGNKLSFAAIFQTTSVSAGQILFETSANGNTNTFTAIADINAVTPTVEMSTDTTPVTTYNVCTTTSTVATSTWKLFMGTIDRSLTSGNVCQAYLWNLDAAPTYRNDAYNTANWSSYALNIGARNASVTSVLVGDLAECFFCSNVWSTTDRLNIQSYARWFYGIGS